MESFRLKLASQDGGAAISCSPSLSCAGLSLLRNLATPQRLAASATPGRVMSGRRQCLSPAAHRAAQAAHSRRNRGLGGTVTPARLSSPVRESGSPRGMHLATLLRCQPAQTLAHASPAKGRLSSFPGTFCTPPRPHREAVPVAQHPGCFPEQAPLEDASVDESPPGSASCMPLIEPSPLPEAETEQGMPAVLQDWPGAGTVAGVFRWATLPSVTRAQESGACSCASFGSTDVVMVRGGACSHGAAVSACATCLAGLAAVAGGAGAMVVAGAAEPVADLVDVQIPTAWLGGGIGDLQRLRGKGVTLSAVSGGVRFEQLSMEELVRMLQ